METLTNPFELLANIKWIWLFSLAVTFWNNSEIVMFTFMILFSLFIFYYLAVMLDTILVKRIHLLTKIKANPYLTNFETVIFFLVLTIYLTHSS
ncbi:hypothetical protein GCM10011346_37530 [Oceanobacillus neutriphilus]|uniref:Uncharacterized protein n=1 Tax=Oceanobacillus neutriphilus TaxID=531815 RepID=A0ABQ2NZ88_9BACI|nr:hypothetical protein GCM10011346_37530 [Oceanobacillus neutriphilus]